jgi:pimeloyl-ACP methyl ester carboxylesterase
MKTSSFKLLLIAALSILLAVSCSKDNIPEEFVPDYLISSEQIVEYSSDEIKAQLSENQMLPAQVEFMIRYGVKGLRITYSTVDAQGNDIEASGALLIPNGDFIKPLISFQHGTITSNADAPSNFSSEGDIMTFLFASTGFVIAIPDYIGYGVSSHMQHPYEHKASLATATRDMLRASREYFKVNNLNHLGDQLFLTGYSEGGSATMATYELLQEKHNAEFNITAVTAGAGAYNKSEFMDWILSSTEELEYINSYVWVLDTYNNVYPQLQRPYSYYFNEPWATLIEEEGVFATIESNPSLLFTQEFIQGVINKTDSDFISAIEDNNSYSWIPQSPLQLYHGSNDSYVPYFNSESAYNAMIDLGATNVELFTIEEGDHITSVMDYAAGTFTFFFQYLM